MSKKTNKPTKYKPRTRCSVTTVLVYDDQGCNRYTIPLRCSQSDAVFEALFPFEENVEVIGYGICADHKLPAGRIQEMGREVLALVQHLVMTARKWKL